MNWYKPAPLSENERLRIYIRNLLSMHSEAFLLDDTTTEFIIELEIIYMIKHLDLIQLQDI